MNRQKLRDAALLLPILGAVLVMPPFVGLFSGPDTFAGVPAIVVYIFVIWAGLISLGILLSHRLQRAEDLNDAEGREPPANEPGHADT